MYFDRIYPINRLTAMIFFKLVNPVNLILKVISLTQRRKTQKKSKTIQLKNFFNNSNSLTQQKTRNKEIFLF